MVSTPLKNMLVKMGSSSPIFGVKIKKYLSCHHLDNHTMDTFGSTHSYGSCLQGGSPWAWPVPLAFGASGTPRRGPCSDTTRIKTWVNKKRRKVMFDTFCVIILYSNIVYIVYDINIYIMYIYICMNLM